MPSYCTRYSSSNTRLPCAWQGESILVMESVLITTPYSVDDCSGPNAQQLGRVQKIVRWHLRTDFRHDLIAHLVLIHSHFQCIPRAKQLEAERKRLKMA
jgi:hypothetical protein